MYDIFIKNYLNEAKTETVSAELTLYSIPIADGLENRVLVDPTVKTEMGKAGSMDFSIHPNHTFYNRFQQMKTIIRVDYDGDTLFRGRTLTIDDSHYSGARKIHLEGDLAFFMDSQQPGIKEEKRSKISIYQHLTNVINEHNTQMRENNEPDKTFELGEVPGHYSSSTSSAQRLTIEDDKFGSESWHRTMDELEDLKKKHGGFFRTRFVSASKSSDGSEHHYLDWLQSYFNSTLNISQPIQVTQNMIDINSTTEVDNLFTVLIPIGDNKGDPLYVEDYKPSGKPKRTKKSISVPELLDFCTDAQLTKGYHTKDEYKNAIKQYGTIYKVQSFSNAKTQDVLWSYAIEWMLNNYIGGIRNFNVSALDLHHFDSSKRKVLSGDYVTIVYPSGGNGATANKNLTVLSGQYYLHNPDKNGYSIGTPSDLINKEYGHNSKSGGKSTAGSSVSQHNGDHDDIDVYTAIDEYKQLASDYIVSHRYNGDIYDQLMAEDPEKAHRAFISTEQYIVEAFTASDDRPTSGHHRKKLQKIMMDGLKGKLTINGPLDHSHDFTDEEVDKINKHNNFLAIDSTKQEFGMKAVMDLIAPQVPTKPMPTLLDIKIQQNKSGKIDVWGADKLTDENALQKISLTGIDGAVNSMLSKLGLDGTGESTTILQDGLTSMLKFFNPSSISSGNAKETAQIDGNEGTGKVGKDSSGGWQVKLNETVTYDDEDGHSKTAAGFVSAKDFSLPEIQSFKTKLIVTDHLIAGKVDAEEIEADLAYIRNLNSDTIHANTQVSAATIRASNMQCDDIKVNRTGGPKSLRDCLTQCTEVKNSSGIVVKLRFGRVDGSTFDVPIA